MNVIVALYATLTVGAVIAGVMGLIILCGMKVSKSSTHARPHLSHTHSRPFLLLLLLYYAE